MKNLANAITLARIALVPVVVFAILSRARYGELWAAGTFVVGAVTDGVDGYVARRYNQVSTFGKLIDPLADKLLIAAALVALVERGILSTWVVVAILGRELAVTGLRAVAAAEGLVIAASPLGKWKTALQVVAIALTILGHMKGQALLRAVAPWAMALAVAVTLASGVDYALRFWRRTAARSR